MPGHPHDLQSPSEWVRRFAPLIARGGRVVDVACGSGRHLRHLRGLGFAVVGIDRDVDALGTAPGLEGIELVARDIESGPWPFAPGTFDGVVVTNYLWRPLLPALIAALREGGVLIYETFARGNERYGRPTNPEFLLRRNELLEWALPQLQVVAFEQGVVARPAPAVVQRICAVREAREPLALAPDSPAGARGD